MNRPNPADRRDGLRALRGSVAWFAIALWNLLLVLAVWLNGGGSLITDRRALAVMALDGVLFAVASFGIVFSPRLRNLVTDPTRRHLYAARTYLLLGIACSALAIPAALVALGML